MERIQDDPRGRGPRDADREPHSIKKIAKNQIPDSIENGCVVVDDDVTEEQLAAIIRDV